MSATKQVRFNTDYYDDGAVKWAAGKYYPVDADTLRQVAAGIAEIVIVEVSTERAEQIAQQASAEQQLTDEAADAVAVDQPPAEVAKEVQTSALPPEAIPVDQA